MVALYGGGEALEAPGWSNTFRTFSNFWSRNIFSKTTIARSPTRRRNLAYIGRSQLMLGLWPEVSWDITDRNIRYKVFNSCLGYYFSNIVIGHKNCSSTVLADCCCVTLMIASQPVAGSWELPESCNWTSPPVCDFVTLWLCALACWLLVHLLSICKLRDWLSSPMLFFWAKSCEGQATPSAIITLVITMMASHDDAWIAMWFDVQA